MTTEEDFQAALDAHPDDWQTRCVFADWLQEHGDPRAEGYRALGTLMRYPRFNGYSYKWDSPKSTKRKPHSQLPSDWFGWNWYFLAHCCTFHFGANTRRDSEDLAAKMFAKLPAARRAELITLGVKA